MEKARFYAGRTGGPPWEVFLVSSCGHVAIFWVAYVAKRIRLLWVRIAFEIIALPVVLFWFVYRPSLWELVVFAPLAAFRFDDRIPEERNLPLAFTRFTVLFLTAVCIIFVDFPAFPVRFGKVSRSFAVFQKTIVQGDLSGMDGNTAMHLSLMDSGASYFVIINGWGTLSFRKCLKNSVVNFALWGIRLALTESTHYFTPEGEYANNCNFFGYLGGVYFVSAILCLTGIRSEFLCAFWGMIHEFTGNKIPFLGYVALFYFANSVGFKVENFHPLYEWSLWLLPIVFSDFEVLNPLREKANMAFNLFCFASLYLVLVIARMFPMNYSDMSPLYRAIDRHPLVFFVLANLVTGGINMTIDANHSGVVVAFSAVVVVFYIAANGTLAFAYIRRVF
jgi:hypothetical protein